MPDLELVLDDGRTVGYADWGPRDGTPLLYFHGVPGSRLDLDPLQAEVGALGARMVSLDRPGFGRSSPRPGRRIEDAPGDALAVADELGLERFAIVGYSSGAPNAIATAAAAGERATALALVAGVTDLGWGPAWAGYVRPAEVELLRLEVDADAVAWCEAHYGADGSGLFAEVGDLGAADTDALADDGFLVGLMGTMAEALRQGMVGYAEDAVAEGSPWRFDPGTITARSSIYHGEQDRIVPIEHGRHNAELIPGASFTAWPQHGHLSVRREIPTIVAALLRLA